MKRISIRELHMSTGKWVRKAAAGEVEVTDRGRVVARIVPAAESGRTKTPYWANPKFTPEFLRIRHKLSGGTDSTVIISEERDRDFV